jgi:hypothetical protein
MILDEKMLRELRSTPAHDTNSQPLPTRAAQINQFELTSNQETG